jgi:hypothetical protein
MYEPIEHRRYWQQVEIDAIEYPLLCETIPQGVRDQLHPWLQQFIGLDRDAASALLEERWLGLKEAMLVSLRECLLELIPFSICVRKKEACLVLYIPEAQPLNCTYATSYYVPPPFDDELIEHNLVRCRFADVRGFATFTRNFGGLRETPPNTAGYFRWPNEWRTLMQITEHPPLREKLGHWVDERGIYHTSVGDVVLMKPSGEVAAWNHEMTTIDPVADDFLGFVEHFVQFLRLRYPCEIWEPNEEEINNERE